MTPNDYEIDDMLPRMNELIQDGCLVFLKWTCPSCGERVTSNQPNTYQTKGYQHEEKADGSLCGGLYMGTRFNYVMIASTGTAQGERGMELLREALED